MKSRSKSLVLVVDDNKDILFNIRLFLEEKGYDVVTAKSGIEAINILSESTELPDLIISDIMMPEMNGYDFFVVISQNPLWNHIPFIFLTAKSTPEDVRLGKLLGADDYVIKPFKGDDLLAIIKGKIMRKKQLLQMNTKIQELLSSLKIDSETSIIEKEIKDFELLLVFWDDKLGPSFQKSYPKAEKINYPIEKVGVQLFHASTLIYGNEKITKSEGILLSIENIKKNGYAYFDAYEDRQERSGQKQYMLAVIAPQINYLDSLILERVFEEISSQIKEKVEWDMESYWEKISKILKTKSIKVDL